MNKYDDTDYQIEREESIEYEEDSVYAHKFAIMQKQINEKEKRIKELEEQLEKANKQLDLDYVDKNYIPKQKVKELFDRLHISDIEPWSFYQVSGDILFDLKEMVEDK